MTVERVQKAVFDLAISRRSAVARVAGFKDLRHNADLCPAVQRTVEDALQLVTRNFSVAYDTQGFRDSGVDVVVRLGEENDRSFIGFQVKSDTEAKPGVVRDLKAQHFDAVAKFGNQLIDYYIVLCWQPDRIDLVRAVSAEFSKVLRTHVVEPAFAWRFLFETSSAERAAIVTSAIENEDPVLNEARSAVSSLTAGQRAIALVLLAASTDTARREVHLTQLRSSSFLAAQAGAEPRWVSGEFPLPPGATVPEAWLARLENDGAEWPSAADIDLLEEFADATGADLWTFAVKDNEILLAVAHDARARYGHEADVLARFLDTLLARPAAPEGAVPENVFTDDLGLAVAYSSLPESEQVGALAELLVANAVRVGLAGGIDPNEFAQELLERLW